MTVTTCKGVPYTELTENQRTLIERLIVSPDKHEASTYHFEQDLTTPETVKVRITDYVSVAFHTAPLPNIWWLHIWPDVIHVELKRTHVNALIETEWTDDDWSKSC